MEEFAMNSRQPRNQQHGDQRWRRGRGRRRFANSTHGNVNNTNEPGSSHSPLVASTNSSHLNPNAEEFRPRNFLNQGDTFQRNRLPDRGRSNDNENGSVFPGPSRQRYQNNYRRGFRPNKHLRSDKEYVLNSNSDTTGADDKQKKRDIPHNKENTKTSNSTNVTKNAGFRSQREMLCDQLSNNSYDCMVCVEKIRKHVSVWACNKCYNIFHLRCVQQWANSSIDELGWRCPGCQSYCDEIPREYRCFCGATKNPLKRVSDVPHTCGNVCNKSKIGGPNCIHNCNILCHPGPCPPCESMETRSCCCGKTKAQMKCSSKNVLTCQNVCEKLLNCQFHHCTKKCHGGPCDPCSVVVKMHCFCKNHTKEEICNSYNYVNRNYCCGQNCGKTLLCGNHKCDLLCHPGECVLCELSPSTVNFCPCGKTSIEEACKIAALPLRTSCTDKIPTCGKPCGKILSCGNGQHICQSVCHIKTCPKCPLKSTRKCRCGNKTYDVACSEITNDDILCDKKCNKKRSCGRHKCNEKCCIDLDHICPIPCNRLLRCGNHNCELLCHNGHCLPCRVVSFDELSCECGTSVIYPPVPCGTKPPMCHQPCPRQHDCDHPVLHNCHSEPSCPPCTYLTTRWCYGKHVERSNVQCQVKEISCGMLCGKILPCEKHHCDRICHPGQCAKESDTCKRPCLTKRPSCGHPCNYPCHTGTCPENIKCRVKVNVTCACTRVQDSLECWKREKEYDRLVTYLMNIEIKKLKEQHKLEENYSSEAILENIKAKTPKSNVLECDKECARLERNRKLMEALQLDDAEATSTFGTPNYSEFLLGTCKKSPNLVEYVHNRLTDLVKKAKMSHRKNETYSFEAMNRDKRRVVHEYSDFFGCLSESFDEEPNRSVVCTASKEKSYFPSVSLIDAVFKPSASCQRKKALNDVEIIQNSKSQILPPSNGWSTQKRTHNSAMVNLVGNTSVGGGSVIAPSNLDFPPLN